MSIKREIKSNPRIKNFVLWLITPTQNPKPRLWVRWLINPFLTQKGKGCLVRRSVRMDLFPWHQLMMGKRTTIEDYTIINNGVGDVLIGENSLIGIGNTVIGPAQIGDHVITAQHVVISGMNHEFRNISCPIRDQPVIKSPILIDDEVWIGANSVILAGVSIGKHSVVGAGSVVTKNVPPYSVVAGNPAKIIKIFNDTTQLWEQVKPSERTGSPQKYSD